jgi:hypothetical protein
MFWLFTNAYPFVQHVQDQIKSFLTVMYEQSERKRSELFRILKWRGRGLKRCQYATDHF